MYTIHDFHQMKRTQLLPAEVVEQITYISKKIGINQLQPEFKVEKVYNVPQQITILLNKLTEDSFKSVQDKIIQLIDKNIEDSKEISVVIFNIIRMNSFYGKLYAKLYFSFVQKWPNFMDFVQEQFRQHLLDLETIQIVSSSNYEEFCKCNELNDKYKTFSQFIVHLTLQKVVSIDGLNTLIQKLIDMLYVLKDSDRKLVMDEIVEHLYLCIIISKPIHKQLNFEKSKLNMTGISNKVLFRLMDIMDLLK
jgi:hypothetical protein